MIKDLLLLLLRLNRLSSVTSEGITFQLRILAHFDTERDGLCCNYELRVHRKNPRADLATIKYNNIAEAMDDIKSRIGFYERKSRR